MTPQQRQRRDNRIAHERAQEEIRLAIELRQAFPELSKSEAYRIAYEKLQREGYVVDGI